VLTGPPSKMSILRGGWQGATALINKHKWLVLRAEGVLILAKSDCTRFRGWMGGGSLGVLARSSCHRKRVCVLIFESGCGGGVGKTPQ